MNDLSLPGLQVAEAAAAVRALAPAGARIVFVSGNFNIVHPGHLRLLNFAADCGDFLVVGVNADDAGHALLPEALRLEGVRSIGIVNHAFLLRGSSAAFIRALQPAVVVKGKEHEGAFNDELAAVESYGGRLLFSSGDVRFSSLDLLQRELRDVGFAGIVKPDDYPARHGFRLCDLPGLVRSLSGMRVVVLGDLIVDEYVSCHPLGMSQEDPTLVVMPIRRDRFVGGAGIVAAHARALGAEVSYFGISGSDEPARFAGDTLTQCGVLHRLIVDESRPTTLKQRFRAGNKTLLRVSHLRQHDIGSDLAEAMLDGARAAAAQADLVVFSDFNYGCLPQGLVDALAEFCAERNVMMAADSQASSQVGDVARFKRMRLLTPTEHEVRLSLRDARSGLVVLAEALRQRARAECVLLTLGPEGLLIHAPGANGHAGVNTDRLPAFNTTPRDTAGAGDCLFITTALALAAGADIWRSAYLGSLAAACQVSRVGNSPLGAAELLRELPA